MLRCPGVIAELTCEPLLVGLCEHFALPLAGELAGDIGMHGRLLSVRGRPGPGLPSGSDLYAELFAPGTGCSSGAVRRRYLLPA